MNDRGYLFLLIGVVLIASPLLGVPNDIASFGTIFIFIGIRSMQTSQRELQNALYFAIFGLIINWSSWLGVELIPDFFIQFRLVPLLFVLERFFDIGVFFWLLKAEYMWAPNKQKRLEWLGSSALGAVYFFMIALTVFSGVDLLINLSPNMLFLIFRIRRPLSLAYYGSLVFIFAKLYHESRGGGSGLRRWN